MDWMNQIGGLLQQYSGADASQAPDTVHNDYDQAAQAAPQSALADGIAAAFHSNQTPPFAQMAAQIFGNASGEQKAGLLNTLIAAADPAVVSQVLGSGGSGGLGQILGGLGGGQQSGAAQEDGSDDSQDNAPQDDTSQDATDGGDTPQVTPEQAAQVSPDVVQELAAHAQNQDPSVVNQISNIVAQEPGLAKVLGGGALSTILSHLAQGAQ
ncbi:MAG: hypothetical protein JO316_16555 [Abitibacteriaceae bacterium]|nr:hypothetical protein [Abditibacteriaceae bacterium]